MKNKKVKLVLKRIAIMLIAIYVIYTFLIQQKKINAYKDDQAKYSSQIALEEERKEELNQTKENINSEKYIEEMARNNLDMYYPNEKVYIDVSK